MKFETLAIHAGQEPDPNNGAVMMPVYLTSTYKQDGVGRPRQGYEYSRTQNPTRKALQDCLAALEGGEFGLAFASGYRGNRYRVAFASTAARTFSLGMMYTAGRSAYSTRCCAASPSTLRLPTQPILKSVAEALTPSTRLVWLETPTNPMLRITDIRAVAEIVHAHPNHPLLVVDNTFATPYLQRPLELGADIVVHSMTKYLGGHSDVVGGAVIVKDKALAEKLYFLQNAVGAVLGPMDCFLVLRGIKTLPLRMDRHAENAAAIVEFLARASQSGEGHLPVSREPSTSRDCEATDEKRRRDDLVHHQRRTRGRASKWWRRQKYSRWQNLWAAWNR